jgi:hypothetical protein
MTSSGQVPDDTADVVHVEADEANSSGPSLEIDVRPVPLSWWWGTSFED